MFADVKRHSKILLVHPREHGTFIHFHWICRSNHVENTQLIWQNTDISEEFYLWRFVGLAKSFVSYIDPCDICEVGRIVATFKTIVFYGSLGFSLNN